MPSPTIFNLEAITTQLTAAFKTCLESACDSVKSSFSNDITQGAQSKSQDIEGLRIQIIANATVLIPTLAPKAIIITSPSAGHTRRVLPKLDVLTYNIKSDNDASIKACVVYAREGSIGANQFIYTGDASATTAEALQKLLDITGALIQKHMFETIAGPEGILVPVSGGGYYANLIDNSPPTEDDVIYWGRKPSPTNPNTPHMSFRSSGSGSGSSTNSGSNLYMNNVNGNGHSTPADNRKDSFTGARGGAHGLGVGPIPDLNMHRSFARHGSAVNIDTGRANASFGAYSPIINGGHASNGNGRM